MTLLIQAFGDTALRVELGMGIDPQLNRRVHSVAEQLRAQPLSGLGEIVPAYTTLILHYNPLQLNYTTLVEWVTQALAQPLTLSEHATRLIELPTRYGGAFGPDLEFVAAQAGLTSAQVIEAHTATDYRVYLMGFMPGFAYLGELPAKLEVPRLSTPRAKVPIGSVGLAGRQTGVYPLESPGGWQLIGRTEVRLFDPTRTPPVLLAPGDRVRFVPLDSDDV